MHEEGIEAVWKRHATIAKAIWAAVDAWGNADGDGNGGGDQSNMPLMHHNIADPAKRSTAVSAITTAPGVAGKVRDWCENEAGVTLGIGLGLAEPGTPQWDQQFRIGHMGHQNVAMTMAVLGSIETALAANGVEHGSGALSAAAKILAAH